MTIEFGDHAQAMPIGASPGAASLLATDLLDADHPTLLAFAREHAQRGNDRERAVALYYAVRDGIRYDPYSADLSVHVMRASTVIELGAGWCVPKATLLTAACRAVGIPARLGFADVRNHLSTQRLRQTMQTDVFVWHGYSEIWLGGAWRKATPAFNIGLCEKFGLLPLDFNGVDGSIYHPFDRSGQRHMEYLQQRGSYDDLPLVQLRADFARVYPGWGAMAGPLADADFDADVSRETPS